MTNEEKAIIDKTCKWLKRNLSRYFTIMQRDYLTGESQLLYNLRNDLENKL